VVVGAKGKKCESNLLLSYPGWFGCSFKSVVRWPPLSGGRKLMFLQVHSSHKHSGSLALLRDSTRAPGLWFSTHDGTQYLPSRHHGPEQSKLYFSTYDTDWTSSTSSLRSSAVPSPSLGSTNADPCLSESVER
jgi:hypothetical protein